MNATWPFKWKRSVVPKRANCSWQLMHHRRCTSLWMKLDCWSLEQSMYPPGGKSSGWLDVLPVDSPGRRWDRWLTHSNCMTASISLSLSHTHMHISVTHSQTRGYINSRWQHSVCVCVECTLLLHRTSHAKHIHTPVGCINHLHTLHKKAKQIKIWVKLNSRHTRKHKVQERERKRPPSIAHNADYGWNPFQQMWLAQHTPSH